MEKPILEERYADNGEFSHWALVSADTGELLWSESIEEMNQKEDDDYYGELVENSSHESCPKCGRSYDDIDFDYQICSKCGWDSDENKFKPDTIQEPTENDFLNGDADILTGEWN